MLENYDMEGKVPLFKGGFRGIFLEVTNFSKLLFYLLGSKSPYPPLNPDYS